MTLEQIKILLIHIYNRTIHEGAIILTGDYPNCGLIFTSSISHDIEVKGHDYFQCLLNLRIELEKQNYYILCNGARKDISCGGMLREASDGLSAYIIRLEEYCHLDESVDIFEYAEPNLVVSVREQEEFSEIHQKSLPEIVGYYAEFAEPISTQIQENIINQLSYHSDWQLLHRKGNRLMLKFFNTSEQPHWNIDIEINKHLINIVLTLGNDLNRENFLIFLNEQCSFYGIVYDLRQF